jgi:demethoxyubiquinone hydroxylase (CLK1/Coq7/Cat5 family)
MEQILAFVLGVSAALLVWGVVVAFKTASKVREIEKQFQALYTELSQRDELVNRRIDQEIDRVDQIYKECLKHTDSRVDKLDAKFCSDGRALTEKSKEFLKG